MCIQLGVGPITSILRSNQGTRSWPRTSNKLCTPMLNWLRSCRMTGVLKLGLNWHSNLVEDKKNDVWTGCILTEAGVMCGGVKERRIQTRRRAWKDSFRREHRRDLWSS